MSIIRELVTRLTYEVNEGALRRYRDGFQSATSSVRDTTSAQNRLNQSIANGGRNVQGLQSGFGRLARVAGFFASIYSVGAILRSADAFGQMEARLRSATASIEEYKTTDSELARISRLTYKSFESSAELFVRTRRTMQDLGHTTQTTIDLTEALSLGMALSSTKTEDQESAISSVSKAIMQGKMKMEEYATLMRTMPRLQIALADGLGVTTDELLRMVQSGQITTDKLLPALQSQLELMRLEAEKMPVTIQDAAQVWRDAFQRMVGTSSVVKGALGVITKSIEFLADNIDKVSIAIGVFASAYGFTKLMLGINAVKEAFRQAQLVALATNTSVFQMFRKGFLFQLIKFAAIMYGIYLIGQDIYVWLNGGKSVLGDLIGPVKEWGNELELVSDIFKGLWGWVTSVWRVIKPYAAIGAAIAGGIWIAVKAAKALRFAFMLIGGPIGLIIALAALVALWIYENWEWVKEKTIEVWNSVSSFFETWWSDTKKGFWQLVDDIVGFFAAIPGKVKAAINAAGGAARDWMDENIPGYSAIVSAGSDALGGILGTPDLSEVLAPSIIPAPNTTTNSATITQTITNNISTTDPMAAGREAAARTGAATQRAVRGFIPNVEVAP